MRRHAHKQQQPTTARSKIVIRPYQKPPQLPSNYYESTVADLLQSTRTLLERDALTRGGSSAMRVVHDVNRGDESAQAAGVSLQHSYTHVVHLVSHQYGPRLYEDLVRSMREAACFVLPSANATTTALLDWIPQQYQAYTDYLLLCKHVFLPLDRSHFWNKETQTAVPTHKPATASGAGSSAASGTLTPATAAAASSSSSLSPANQQTLWHVGLSQFAQRLHELQLGTQLYQFWKKALLNDWNLVSTEKRGQLQHIWYMWHDLGQLHEWPLQHDLQDYWQRVSQDWKATVPYKAAAFLQFCHDKQHHLFHWPWLPLAWLAHLLHMHLFAPHLHAEFLLHAQHLHPLMEAAMQQQQHGISGTITPGTPTSATASSNQGNLALYVSSSSMHQLWMLALRVPQGQALVARAIALFCKHEGHQRVRKENCIVELLNLQDAVGNVLATLPDSKVVNLKPVWEDVVNVDVQPSVAELLPKFLDGILRSVKKLDQYQNQLIKIVRGLFVPLQSKDVFEAFYKRDLAKRLLWNRVVSMDVEKQVCSFLKAECGAGFTSKMEGMFQDVDWSRETMMVYKQSHPHAPPGSVEMEVQVLTTGYWPVYPLYPNLIVPEALKQPQEQFANHYKAKYQGRRMTWQYALGHCVVKCSGFKKTYELVVSLLQALVLAEFESATTKLSLPALMQAVGIEDRDEMERILQSLSLGKGGTRVLRKLDFDAEPGKKKVRMTVDDNDLFEINRNFESNQRRIRINNIMMKETMAERDKTVEGVSRDRLYLIDAVLVRIMKARKTIAHQALIPQVLEQIKFPAQPSDIKMRIESLIEREYMERDAQDRSRYNYLA